MENSRYSEGLKKSIFLGMYVPGSHRVHGKQKYFISIQIPGRNIRFDYF